MIWHLVAAAFAGLGAAGVGLLLRLLSGKRLPRWIIPALAGLGMLGYQVNYEYTWFQHKREQLPASARVVDIDQQQVFWRPWTYFHPLTTAFSVVDRDNRKVSQADGQQLVEFLLYRFESPNMNRLVHQPYLMNCTTGQQLPIAEQTRQPDLNDMERVARDSALYRTVCQDL